MCPSRKRFSLNDAHRQPVGSLIGQIVTARRRQAGLPNICCGLLLISLQTVHYLLQLDSPMPLSHAALPVNPAKPELGR